MSKIYESIIAGLTEAVEDAKAEKKVLPRRTVTIAPVKNYNASEIRDIRKKQADKFSQLSFTT